MPTYVYINGYPGVGKLIVAKELEKLIPNSKVYSNHLLIDPVAPLVDRSSPEYNEIRTALRDFILNIVATSEATKHTTWIFTDARSTSPSDVSVAQDYERAAGKRGVPFVPIILRCELEENLQRVTGKGRGGDVDTKLTDPEILRLLRKEELFCFGGARELELDVTNINPAEAAKQVLEHIHNMDKKPEQR